MAMIGKILWWDRRDQEGVILDGSGNQYFFNYSLISAKILSQLKDDLLVEFETALPSNNGTVCAKSVRPITDKLKKRAEREFQGQKQLSIEGV